MLTLDDIKEALRVDYPDHDSYLERLLQGEIIRAEQMTGQKEACFNEDINNGIIEAVGAMFTNRNNTSDSDLMASTIIYRRNSIKPMF